MENHGHLPKPRKPHSMSRRTARKSQGSMLANAKKPSAINVGMFPPPITISPQTAQQQAFRNYSTRGLPKGFESIAKKGAHRTINNQGLNMILSNMAAIGVKKQFESFVNQNAMGTSNLLKSNPMASRPRKNRTAVGMNVNSSTTDSYKESQKRPKTSSRVFDMLKSLDIQQYSRKFVDLGYENDICKLAFLNKKQRREFIQSLKPLPGHKDKLLKMFSMLDEIISNEGEMAITHPDTLKINKLVNNTQSGSIKLQILQK